MSQGDASEVAAKVGAVLVVGGGVAGVQSALDLAELGIKVYLVERQAAVGGRMAQLDKTFPTNDCAMCILGPKMSACVRHPDIEVLSYSELIELDGQPGNFRATILRHPRYVDEETCNGCGQCEQACPIKAPAEFDVGLGARKAIYRLFPQAVPPTYVIDRDACIDCGKCDQVCEPNAIDRTMEPRQVEINAGAVILCPGSELADAGDRGEYGFGVYENVVTSLQFERMLSASGPSSGAVVRPSDDKIPGKIAFVQCVGSRETREAGGYCSAVCCMHATKQAIIAKEHHADTEATIFFIDVRAHGKGFERYFRQAEGERGVRFVRCVISKVREIAGSGDLRMRYVTEDGQNREEVFDLLVLSVGQRPSDEFRHLAGRLGLNTDGDGFCVGEHMSTAATSRPGVFVAGMCAAPKDIADAVAQASAAAAGASTALASARGSLVERVETPPERAVADESARIGVVVCRCGANIGDTVDVPQVVAHARGLPGVVWADEDLFACSAEAQKRLGHVIREHDLNRVVIAACTPRTHEGLFGDLLAQVGLNRHLLEMANIREHCSWVHRGEPEAATAKAKALVRMATAKVGGSEPLWEATAPVTPRALVIGGGLAGMTAALTIAEQGAEVWLVERERELGGNLKDVYLTQAGDAVQPYLQALTSQAQSHPLIRVRTSSEVTEVTGHVGNFTTKLVGRDNGRADGEELQHGVIVVATGAQESVPTEYCYGQTDRIVTLRELEQRMCAGPGLDDVNTMAIILCVGSRDEQRPYCSRICCGHAIKVALAAKRRRPDMRLYVLYKDICAYGLSERYYAEAREAGVVFIRYGDDSKPRLTEGPPLRLTVAEPVLGEQIELAPDVVALGTGIVPAAGNRALASLLKVPLDPDGFFLEAHMKLRPVEFSTPGMFVCGLAHSPRSMHESICQAQAAAVKAATILGKSEITLQATTAQIDQDLCTGCQTCVNVCPYEAIAFDETARVSEVNEVLCRGCGSCASACPSGAVELSNFRRSQMYAQIEEALR